MKGPALNTHLLSSTSAGSSAGGLGTPGLGRSNGSITRKSSGRRKSQIIEEEEENDEEETVEEVEAFSPVEAGEAVVWEESEGLSSSASATSPDTSAAMKEALSGLDRVESLPLSLRGGTS